MRLAPSLITTLVLAAPAGAAKHHHRPPRAKKLLEKAKGPITITIESVDLQGALVTTLLTGINRAPDGRLFTFHDDHDRHFIATDARCEAVDAKVRCVLDYPRPYLSAGVVGLTVHLHGREIAAASDEVAARFAAARAPAPPPAAAIPRPGSDGRALDKPRPRADGGG